jgi:polysaccharide biosynthesis protein PslH
VSEASTPPTSSVSRIRRPASVARAAAGLFSSRPLTHCVLDARDTRAQLASLVARARPDVVLAYCSGMARLALEPPLDMLPFVLDIVDVDSSKWKRLASSGTPPLSWVHAREARTLAAFEAHAAVRARETLAVNERERQEMLRLAPGARVSVVPNGIDAVSFQAPGPPATEAVVVFCGVMDYRPNESGVLWFARDVWPLVTRARPDARFIVVGARPTSAIRALPGSDPTIQVTGSVPAVQPFLWQAAVSVAPLALAQGLQNKVLEAIAAGLPVVVTPQVAEGLPPDVASSCLVSAAPQDFADAVLRLLAMSPRERNELASRANVPRYSWEQCLAPLRQILESAAQGDR